MRRMISLGAAVRLGDVREAGAHFVQVDVVVGKKAQAGLRVAEDGGERLIQLVRERGGEFAEQRDAADAREFGLLLVRAFEFRELALMFAPRMPPRGAAIRRRRARCRRRCGTTASARKAAAR